MGPAAIGLGHGPTVKNRQGRRFLTSSSSKHNAYRLPSFAKNGYPMLKPTGSTECLNERKARMTNPCRTCDLCESDKNNPRCLKCSKRVKYVSTLGRDLCYSSCRSDMEASVPRVSLMSRQAQFMAGNPEIHY
jgi:hypothetical protein